MSYKFNQHEITNIKQEKINHNSEVKTYKLSPEEIAEKFKNVKKDKPNYLFVSGLTHERRMKK